MKVIEYIQDIGIYKGSIDFIFKMSILFVSFIAPVQGFLICLTTLIVLDLLTGILAARRKRQKITSSKLSRTITKTLVYVFTILLVHSVNQYIILTEGIPLTSMISSFIILTELQSIFENVNVLARNNILKLIIDKLSLVTKGRVTTIKKRNNKKS